MLRCLIFDVDGTLADTERHGHRPAFNRAFADLGIDWHWDETLYGELLGVTGGKERIRYFLECYNPPIPNDLPLGWIDWVHQTKTRYYTDWVRTGGIPPRAGVMRLLQEARQQGIRLAISTTTSFDNVTSLLSSSFGEGVVDWFEIIGAGDIVSRKKPASDIYHYVLDQCQIAPNECVAIEDSAVGLRAAMGAGIPTIITANDYTIGQDFSGAMIILDSLGDPRIPATVLSAPVELGGGYLTINTLLDLYRIWAESQSQLKQI